MKINNSERRRVFAVFLIFACWVVFILFSLVRIQVFNYSKNVARVRAQSNRMFEVHPKRGTIFDSKGDILAISIKAKSAFLGSKNESHSLALLKSIRRKIKLTYKEYKKIEKRIRTGDHFIWIKRKLTDKEYKSLLAIKKSNKSQSHLDFIEEYKRVYPQGATACHILGGVGVDEQGLYGVEYSLDSVIRGQGGKARVMQDARRKAFNLEYLTRPAPGKDIYLTIDSSIQFFVEKELQKVVDNFKARGGAVIVTDARDGAVLAMASYPDYRPDRIKYASIDVLRNRGIAYNYHPGSTFKIVLASIALEKNVCSPLREFNCHNGVYKVRKETIYDVHPYSRLTFEGIIIKSSNIGAAKIGERVGRNRLYEGIRTFGFGRRIGLELPAEENGILHPVKTWSGVSVPYLSHGYEIAVTPIQMTRAFNVLASGGFLMKPYVIKKIDGVFLKQPSRERILSASTVHRMRNIMQEVVNTGTGTKSRIDGIKIAGKTGTTKKIGKSKKYVSSFGGFFPADNPRVTMFVVIEEPKGLYYGGDVAAPLFKSIAERLLIYLRVFPELDKRNEIRI